VEALDILTSTVNFAHPDVTLSLDLSGVIVSAALSNAVSNQITADWIGRAWSDTVAGEGNARVQQMLRDACATGVSSFGQVRQRFPSGLELAVEYATVRLGGGAGLIAIGRSLEAVSDLRSRLMAAQRSMERDYWKLREVETRYRLLFDASSQPVLLIGANDTRIEEANPAAIRALGVASDCELLPEILESQREGFHAMLARVREHGKAPGVVLHLGPDRVPWLVRASLVAGEPRGVFVLQLSPSVTRVDRPGPGVRWEELVARLREAFVALSPDGTILRANQAFLDLVEHATEVSVVGQRLSRWVSGADASALLDDPGRRQWIGELSAKIRGELGRETDVRIAAAGDADVNPRQLGLLLLREATAPAAEAPVVSVASKVGRAPLRAIVEETVKSVERTCIESALALAKGNRTSAAQMLGMSRQSLHTKLSRYRSPAKKGVSR
jgi:transcriptional regulator PpsR